MTERVVERKNKKLRRPEFFLSHQKIEVSQFCWTIILWNFTVLLLRWWSARMGQECRGQNTKNLK